MHLYRSHSCGDLSLKNIGEEVKLSGWIDRKRDHGGLLFLDLRDQYGVVQLVADSDNKFFSKDTKFPVIAVSPHYHNKKKNKFNL